VTPLVFMSVALFMMYYLIVTQPKQSIAGFLMMLAGLAIYWVAQMGASQAPSRQASIEVRSSH
jgi:basic amino acid/polyamine antiporter, APA family